MNTITTKAFLPEPKIRIILGEFIDRYNPAEVSEGCSLYHFPELDPVSRFPMHATRISDWTLRMLRGIFWPTVIVTQSHIIISIIAEQISVGKIDHSDVEIWMFNDHYPMGLYYSKIYTITKEGMLDSSWPFGWFDC